jgi:hypothetical protein
VAISNPSSFRAEARYQRVCAACGRAGENFHAHHIVSKRLLRRLKLPLWDTRNALRLCPSCHMQAEWGGVERLRIPCDRLSNDNICYIYSVLGPAIGTLEKMYPRLIIDPRMTRHLDGACELCQR